jgi:DNA/RNA endonuclease YhcR with UshA esterase domain
MNKYLLIVLILCIAILTGCSKKESEIKIKKQEDTTVKVKQPETQVPLKDEPQQNKENTESSAGQKKNPVTAEVKRITTSDLKSSIGNKVILKAYIADVTVREKVAYLNFDGKYPKNTGSVTIFASKFDEFGDMMKYKNKNVEVTGYVSEYQGKPQIIVNSQDQIKVLN